MIKRFLVLIIIILFISSAALIGPVAAATTGTTAVTGNPKVAVSIALNLSSVFLDLDPAVSPALNDSLAVIVSANTPFTVTVEDNSGRAGPDQGYMGNYTGAAYDPINTKLAAALALTGTTNTTTSAVGLAPPITATPQNLYSGTAKVNTQWLLPNTFSQVVSYDDPRLPAASVYRIDLLFTIGAT